MTRAEDVCAQFVASKRALKASWATVARMTGASELELRRRFDADFRANHPVAQSVISPRQRVRRGLEKAGFTSDAAVILARLWQANGARVMPRELVSGIAGRALASHLVADAKRDALRRCVTFAKPEPGTGGQALTAEGVIKIARLAGLEGGS